MSFVRTKYSADSGSVHWIRLEEATVAAAGTPPAGTVTSPIQVKVSKSNREFGLRPRGLRLTRVIGAPGVIVTRRKFLPVLTTAAWTAATYNPGSEITIDGVTWTVDARVSEDN